MIVSKYFLGWLSRSQMIMGAKTASDQEGNRTSILPTDEHWLRLMVGTP